MSEISILAAINKLRFFLTPKEKKKWLGMVSFALSVSLLEVMAASTVIIFAEILNKPERGKYYLSYLNIGQEWPYQKLIFFATVLCAFVFLIKNSIASFEVFFQNYTIQKMNFDFKERLLRTYSNLDYNFYLTRNSSFGTSVVGGDAEFIFSIGMVALANILSESIVFICLIIMITIINPSLFFILFGLSLAIGMGVARFCMPLFYKWGTVLQESRLLSSQHLSQFFHSYKEIILLNKCMNFIKTYLQYSKKTCHIQAFSMATNSLPRLIIELIFVSLFVVVVGYICFKQNNPEALMGVLGGYLYVGFRLMPGLNRIISQLNSFKSTIPNINRVFDEIRLTNKQHIYLEQPKFTFNKTISLENISFAYNNVKKEALKNINFVIERGERIGIIGETGSGKSTLVDVILGLLRPVQGKILIDDQFPPHCRQWHQHIGYVPQTLYLTDDTIEANIALGEKSEEIDRYRLQKAIEDAQLSPFILSLPQGLLTEVGERGIRLSGGERQRISIARALYRSPDVLIFDEATSALDNATEERVMETINKVSENRTVIMIAHRLTTLKDCDRIIVMQNGTIKEIKHYSALIETSSETSVI